MRIDRRAFALLFVFFGSFSFLSTRTCAENALAAPAPSFQFRMDSTYCASLFYLIDNMSGGAPYFARDYYRTFWEKRFGLTEKDSALLSRYAEIRKLYATDLKEPSVHLADKWPLLFIGNEALEQAWQKAELLLADADVEVLRTIFSHFDAKFRPIWDEDAGDLRRAALEFDSEGYDRKTAAFLTEVAKFYGLEPGLRRRYTVALVWHPGRNNSGNMSHANRIDRLMLVEYPPKETIQERIDVIVHEFVHDLFDAMPKDGGASFAASLLNQDPRSCLFFIQGMNEGMAAALGQGLFVQRNFPSKFSFDRSWYATDVDKFAKAVFPLVKETVEKSSATIQDPGSRWCEIVRPLAERAHLSDFLWSDVFLSDSPSESLFTSLNKHFAVADAYAFTLDRPEDMQEAGRLLRREPARPIVALFDPASLKGGLVNALNDFVGAERVSAFKERGLKESVAAIGHTDTGRLYVMAAASKSEIDWLLETLNSMPYPASSTLRSIREMSER